VLEPQLPQKIAKEQTVSTIKAEPIRAPYADAAPLFGPEDDVGQVAASQSG